MLSYLNTDELIISSWQLIRYHPHFIHPMIFLQLLSLFTRWFSVQASKRFKHRANWQVVLLNCCY